MPSPTVASFSPDSNVVGDGITNVNHVTLTGTAVAGSAVEVFDGATQIGTATANGSGAWSFATATLTDGTPAFTIPQPSPAGKGEPLERHRFIVNRQDYVEHGAERDWRRQCGGDDQGRLD